MFVPILVIELLCSGAIQILDTIYINTVRLYIIAGLSAGDRYKAECRKKGH
jgi:hypothetical protein